MRKIIFFIILGVSVLGVIHLSFGEGKKLRREMELLLDKDILYLNDGEVIQGWMWKQEGDLIAGQREKGGTFVVNPSQCQIIQENVLFHYLEKLI